MRAMILSIALATLTGCGTCTGVSCPDFEDAVPGTHTATVLDQADVAASTDNTEPYSDETATFEYTGSEAVLTYADEEGNIWEVRYSTASARDGA
jgi:predicted small lipoprotein YifL